MSIPITNNTSESRFEGVVDGQTAVLTYEVQGERMTLTHTRVPSAIEGHGVGSALVQAALEYARGTNLLVVAQCPFVAKYIAEHPQYQFLVAK